VCTRSMHMFQDLGPSMGSLRSCPKVFLDPSRMASQVLRRCDADTKHILFFLTRKFFFFDTKLVAVPHTCGSRASDAHMSQVTHTLSPQMSHVAVTGHYHHASVTHT
jgi:hypothetical protein